MPLGRVVELLVGGHLGEEVRQPPGVRHRGELEEDPARRVVLRDRLEGFEILEPGAEHLPCNADPLDAVTAGVWTCGLSYIRREDALHEMLIYGVSFDL